MKQLNLRIYDYIEKKFSKRKQLLLLWGILFICMIPYYLAYFPGVFGYDTPVQMLMFFGTFPLSSFHPLAHTFLIGWCISLGEALFTSKLAGFGIYIVFQWLLISNVLALSFRKLLLKRINIFLFIILFGWTIFNPAMMVLSFNSTKDILYSVFFLYFILFLWDYFDARKQDAPVPGTIFAGIIIFGILSCMFRNQGIYILIVLTVIFAFCRLKDYRIIASVATAIVLFFAYSIFCSKVLKIPGTNNREMLSVPITQVSYTVSEYLAGNEKITISEEDLNNVFEIIPKEAFENAENVSFDCADYYKSHFDTDTFSKDMGKYIKSYVKMGYSNLGAYFSSFGRLIAPYFWIESNQYRGLCYDPMFTGPEYLDLPVISLAPTFRKITFAWITLPCYFFVLEPGIGLYILLGGLVFSIIKKKKDVALIFLPLFLYFGTCLLGPVALLRYLYPIMIATPALVGVLVSEKNLR